MTPENKILRDLAAGQTTADSLAPRVGLHTQAADVILRRLLGENKIAAHPLGGKLQNVPVYRLLS